jgi:rhodanese-related sulfurtransferase
VNYIYILFLVSSVACAESYKAMKPEVQEALEQALHTIYHVSTQQVQEMVQQDFGLIPHISAEELQAKMVANPALLVVNVLSNNWYEDCHITGSINVPLKQLIYMVDEWDRNQEIIVYCALDACDAAEKAYVLLRCMGFTHVVDYQGGIKEWFQLGLPVQGPCAASYLHDASESDRYSEWNDRSFDFKEALQHRITI